MRVVALSFATLMSWSPDAIRDALATHGALRVADCPSLQSTQSFVEHMGWMPPSSRLAYVREDSATRAATPLQYQTTSDKGERPRHKLFFCARPAPIGGEIVLVDGRLVATLSHEISKGVTQRLGVGVTYERTLPFEDDPSSPIGKSWRRVFQSDTKTVVEAALERSELQWKWRSNASLWVRSRRMPAFTTLGDDERVFSNSMFSVSRTWNDARNRGVECIRFENGESIPASYVEDLHAAAWKTRYECRLQARELLVVDNLRTMHARNSFEGRREVLTTLVP